MQDTNHDARAEAEAYAAKGYSVFPLKPRLKKPAARATRWEEGRFTPKDIEPGENIGMVMGSKSGLIDIDLDSPEAVELARDYLPPTGWIFGHESRPETHYVYRVESAPGETHKTHKFKDPYGMNVEFRADGAYTMVPPSIHPSGERVRNDADGEPAIVDPVVLLEACDRLAGRCATRRYFQRIDWAQVHRPAPPEHERYAKAALAGEVENVRQAVEGSRNDTLNIAALKLGHYVGANVLQQGEVEDALRDAAAECGLPGREAEGTIASGLLAGIAEPWTPQDERTGCNPTDAPLAPADAAQRPRGWHSTAFGDLEYREPDWLIPDLIEKNALTCIFGKWGVGKSFVAIDIACHVGAGVPYDGEPVEKGGVLYLAGEGKNDFTTRIKAWGIYHDIDPATINGRMGPTFDMLDPTAVTAMIGQVQGEMGEAPSLVVVDTLARSFNGADENATDAMNRFIASCDMIRNAFGCAVLIVHHPGHGSGERSRGNSSFPAALDAEYLLKDEHGVLVMRATKMKIARQPDDRTFTKKEIATGGVDRKGEPLGSLVLVPAGAVDVSALSAQAEKAKGPKGDLPKQALKVARALMHESGGEPVSMADLRQGCRADGMDRRRITETLERLVEGDFITVEDGYVTAC